MEEVQGVTSLGARTTGCATLGSSLDNSRATPETVAMIELLRRMFLMDFWKGLSLTFRTQNPKNVYTEQYPLERPMVAERYRGAPRLNNNPETGETLCIACNLCALACPENLIVVGWQRDDTTRRKGSDHFHLRYVALYVLRLVRRCVPHRLPRAHPRL